MKYACGITLYNPTDDIVERINNYSDVFDLVYLFDNTESKEKHLNFYSELNKIINKPHIIYLSDSKNCGLPYAFNRIIDIVLKNDIDYLCTLDQDSDFRKEDIEAVKNYIHTHPEQIFPLIAPRIIYQNEKFNKEETISVQRYVIASGSFINLYILKESGIRFDENYFIDRFEIDFEKQLQLSGYNIIQYNGAVLYQELGTSSGHKHPNHSELRHYYLFRNRLYYNNKYYSKIKRYLLNISQTIKHILLIVLFENNKILKLKQLYPAISDYKKGKMGKRGE
ncbi:MAG: glycosyltransferase [Clostridiales bacterium]|nr:glycosyltransferase [Clostridiales bacterium]